MKDTTGGSKYKKGRDEFLQLIGVEKEINKENNLNKTRGVILDRRQG